MILAIVALVGFVALPGLDVSAAPTAEELRASSGKKPRCLWPKRDCYPPANLWYRVSVEFDAKLVQRFRPPNYGIRQCFPCSERTTELKWRIESNTAVRLRLMCDDLSDSGGPFLVKRRINGKRRTIGGCPRGARARGRYETLMFGANGHGEIERWKHTMVADPYETDSVRCDGYTASSEAPRQGLSGAIRTAGGSAAGIDIGISPSGRPVTPSGGRVRYTCLLKVTGQTWTTDDHLVSSGAGCCHILGSTGWYQRDDLGWRPITERLHFSPHARNFGGRYQANLLAFQEEITESPVQPPPPAGAAWLTAEQGYGYTVVLRPCPDKGRDVEGCAR
jgi:hypothetical protein